MANEKRLIDADVVLEQLADIMRELPTPTELYDDGMIGGLDSAFSIIEKASTVDAVEVVRCGECWAYNQPDCPMNGSPGKVSVSDFCSYGERRTE